MSEVSESEESPAKKRRGVGNAVTKMKAARLSGEEFVTTCGKLVEKKSIGPDCDCRKKCTFNFTEEQKLKIINTVYSGRPKNERDTYLIGLIERFDVQRHRPKGLDSKQLLSSFKYHAMVDGNKVDVCRKAYLSLHAVTSKVVFRLTSILAKGEQPIDMRGRHGSHAKIPNEVLIKLNEHIESYPIKKSHYSSVEVTYLEAGLTCKIMHDMFIGKHPDLSQTIKYEYFLNYYKENYGYRFGRPQVDVCSTCEDLNTKIKSQNLNDGAKKTAAVELMVHKRRACKFYKKIQEITELCKKRDDVHAMCFDFMQNLPLPCMPVQEMFYLRKLWHYVFCVHSLGDNKSTMYTYHEGVAKKGANDVCSMINDYIKTSVNEKVKTLYVFSDACPGQNRNQTMVRYFLSLTLMKRFNEIQVFFPTRGHSFLPCDRDFGVIKRVIRRHDRVYSPEQYNRMIETAKNLEPKFSVKNIENQDILDFNKWWPTFFKKTCKSVRTKETFKISTYSHLSFSVAKRGYVTARPFIDGMLSDSVFKLYKGGEVFLPNEKAYDGKIPIKEAKIIDVGKIKHYIPDEHRFFYNNILEWPTTTANQEDGYD